MHQCFKKIYLDVTAFPLSLHLSRKQAACQIVRIFIKPVKITIVIIILPTNVIKIIQRDKTVESLMLHHSYPDMCTHETYDFSLRKTVTSSFMTSSQGPPYPSHGVMKSIAQSSPFRHAPCPFSLPGDSWP